jgi:hypothetical protein
MKKKKGKKDMTGQPSAMPQNNSIPKTYKKNISKKPGRRVWQSSPWHT